MKRLLSSQSSQAEQVKFVVKAAKKFLNWSDNFDKINKINFKLLSKFYRIEKIKETSKILNKKNSGTSKAFWLLKLHALKALKLKQNLNLLTGFKTKQKLKKILF